MEFLQVQFDTSEYFDSTRKCTECLSLLAEESICNVCGKPATTVLTLPLYDSGTVDIDTTIDKPFAADKIYAFKSTITPGQRKFQYASVLPYQLIYCLSNGYAALTPVASDAEYIALDDNTKRILALELNVPGSDAIISSESVSNCTISARFLPLGFYNATAQFGLMFGYQSGTYHYLVIKPLSVGEVRCSVYKHTAGSDSLLSTSKIVCGAKEDVWMSLMVHLGVDKTYVFVNGINTNTFNTGNITGEWGFLIQATKVLITKPYVTGNISLFVPINSFDFKGLLFYRCRIGTGSSTSDVTWSNWSRDIYNSVDKYNGNECRVLHNNYHLGNDYSVFISDVQNLTGIKGITWNRSLSEAIIQ